MAQINRVKELKINEDKVIQDLAVKLDQDLQTKIQLAFTSEQEAQRKEEMLKRDNETKEEMVHHIS